MCLFTMGLDEGQQWADVSLWKALKPFRSALNDDLLSKLLEGGF